MHQDEPAPAPAPDPAAPSDAAYARRVRELNERAESARDLVRAHAARVEQEFAQHRIRSRSERGWLLQRPSANDPGRWDSFCATEVVALGGWARLMVHGDISPVLFGNGDSNDPRRLVAWIASSDVDYATRKVLDPHNRDVAWREEPEVARHELLGHLRDREEAAQVELAEALAQAEGEWSEYDEEGEPEDEDERTHRARVAEQRTVRARAVAELPPLLGRLLARGADEAEVGAALPAGFPDWVHRAVLDEVPAAPRRLRWAAAGRAVTEALRALSRGDAVRDVRRALYEAEGTGFDGETFSTLGRVTDTSVIYARAAVRRLHALLLAEEAAAAAAPDAAPA